MIRYYEQIGLILPAALHSPGLRSWVLGDRDQHPPVNTYRAVHFLVLQGEWQVTAMLYQELASMPT